MEINKSMSKTLVFAVSGRIDNTSAPKLAEEIAGFSEDYQKLCLDLKDTDYISSAGLRVILATQKEAQANGKCFTLSNVSKNIMEILDMTGFLDILKIE